MIARFFFLSRSIVYVKHMHIMLERRSAKLIEWILHIARLNKYFKQKHILQRTSGVGQSIC